MHGTGLVNALTTLSVGGSIVTLAGRHFDPVELLDTVEREGVKSMTIVGDAFGRPILRALDAEPGRWDISALRVIISSGVMWSKETKDGLLRHNERLILVDTLGSSEAMGMATSATTADDAAASGTFRLADTTRVISEQGGDVVPGSGEVGLVAMSGPMPLGYYKDPDKSAATFRIVDGVRYTIPGDWATVDADGNRAPARPRQPVHQHRRGEGLPGGGRGGAQAASGGRRRRCRRRPRRALRRGDPGTRRARRRRRDRRSRPHRPRQGSGWPPTRRRSG